MPKSEHEMYAIIGISSYKDDLMSLPVSSIETAAKWYSEHFGFSVISTDDNSVEVGVDDHRIGFRTDTDRNPEEEGAAIKVENIHDARNFLQKSGLEIADPKTEERNGETFECFFVIAPDGLCYYFYAAKT